MQELTKELLDRQTDTFEKRASAQPSLLWNLFAGRTAAAGAAAATAPTPRRPQAVPLHKLVAKSSWLTDIKYLEEELEEERTWEQYENELATVLGVDGGRATLRVCPLLHTLLESPGRALLLCIRSDCYDAHIEVTLIRGVPSAAGDAARCGGRRRRTRRAS